MTAPRRPASSSRRTRTLGAWLASACVLAGGLALTLALPAGAQSAQATSTTSCPATNAPNELVLGGGTPQTAKLDSAFATPFQVSLANSNGCPLTTALAGTVITFSAPASGASGTFASSGTATVALGTDQTGAATAPMFTANGIAGSYTLTASSTYGSVSFELTNSAAGIPASVSAQPPARQSATVGDHFPDRLQALVRDADGNPVQGVTVTFSLGAGSQGAQGAGSGGGAGATFAAGATQVTAMTDAAGVATSPTLTAGATAGRFDASASVQGVTDAAVFSLDDLAAAAPRIAVVEGSGQRAVIGGRYRHPLEVRLTSSAGTPLAGVSVTFAIGGAAGSGSSSGAGASFATGASSVTETTDARGEAVSPTVIANTTSGSFSATATIAATTKVASFALRNLPGRPDAIAAGVGASQTATVGSRFAIPLAVTVTDAHANPVGGVAVRFSVPIHGPSGGFGATRRRSVTVRTNASGVAVAPAFYANHTDGGYVVKATAAGAGAAGFALVNVPPGPAR